MDNYSKFSNVFTKPLSKKLEKTFFNIIKIIGPKNIPITPINLKPVYIAIIVKIGCIPMFPANYPRLYKLPNYRHYYPKYYY